MPLTSDDSRGRQETHCNSKHQVQRDGPVLEVKVESNRGTWLEVTVSYVGADIQVSTQTVVPTCIHCTHKKRGVDCHCASDHPSAAQCGLLLLASHGWPGAAGAASTALP